jgi:glucose/mannose-6-phosphate isomerase
MLAHLQALPDQMADAARLVAGFDLPAAYGTAKCIVVAGMGGSAIGGDLARALFVDSLCVPFFVWRDYGLPAFVDHQSLVIASSYSGATEETLSAVERALTLGAPVVGITAGGPLAARLTGAGHPVLQFTYAAQPRAAVGYSLVPLVGLLARLGYVHDQGAALQAAIQAAREAGERFGPSVPTEANGAKQLAATLRDRLVAVYGAGFLAPVARRWKTQCNENAKHWACFEELPELDHNAVMGYQYPADLSAQLHVVMLGSGLLSSRLHLRCAATVDLLDRHAVPHTAVEAWGDAPLAHQVSALTYGDWTSYYLALVNGVDPTGIAAIDHLKARLAEAP